MIKSFSFKNYKAFKEGEIIIKPITILLGANSVGKSSILQFISMVKQTFNIEKEYKSALKLNGEYISLGEIENIFHNQKTDTPIEISFKLNGNDINQKINRLKRVFENSTEDILVGLERSIFIITNEKNENYRGRRLYNNEEKIDYSNLLSNIKVRKNKINRLINETNSKNIEDILSRSFMHHNYRKNIKKIFSLEKNKIELKLNDYQATYNFFEKVENLQSVDISISYQIIYRNKNLEIDNIEIKNSQGIILGYKYKSTKGGKKHTLYSDLFEEDFFSKYSSIFGNSIYFEKLNIFKKGEEKEINLNDNSDNKTTDKKLNENIFIENIFYFLKIIINNLQNNFLAENINYVNPLRAFPKRYYFLDESNVSSSLNTINGNQLTEILKDNKNIKKKVNERLNNFQLKVDVEKLADTIHNIKINQHGLKLDITDVGFGLSQVLPVIVQGFLSQEDSLTIIEQPEVHLHPQMQADLADLFIDIVQTNKNEDEENEGKNFLIETHSEYLLKRLRRRIAEKKILSENVAIYFIHPKDEKTKYGSIEKIEISKTGNFQRPKNFYSSDLEDTIEFLKHQK